MRVYLDHNSTSPLRPEVRARLIAVLDALGGNPSSLHAEGRRARGVLDQAREQVAAALGVHEEEVIFTSGGTESNNLALLGVLDAAPRARGLVTSAIEHSSVLGAAREIAAGGRPLALVPVDGAGRIDPEALVSAARRTPPALVSIQAANNEVGTLQPLADLAARVAALPGPPPLLHTDAVQALGRIPLDLGGWDLASFSAHKLGGPVGVGVLWRRRGTALRPRTFGGAQEHELRPGTEDTAGIAAAALAIELAVREREDRARTTAALARELATDLARAIPALELLGPPLDAADRLHNTLCVLVPGTDGKVLVTRLDLDGLAVSAGSACASGSLEPSHVLLAMGHDEARARAGLRLSLGWSTTRADCKRAVDILRKTFAPSHAT